MASDTYLPRLVPALVFFSLALTLNGQGPAVAAQETNGTFDIRTVSTIGGGLVLADGLDDVTFLDVRLTATVESFSPRHDIPKGESFEWGTRIRLADASRVYRVLEQNGTSFIRVHDGGVTTLAEEPGDGLTSGFSSTVAAPRFGPWVAFATIGTPTIPARVYLARTDILGQTSDVDVSPPGGLPTLNTGSLTFAQGALFFTDATTLWRHDLATGQTAAVTMPVSTSWVDPEISVSGDGTTIALRAGDSENLNVLIISSADGLQLNAFGQPGPKLPIGYQSPSSRPGFALSHDGSLVPYVESTSSQRTLFVAENFGQYENKTLGSVGVSTLIGIESEIALGDGSNGTSAGPRLVLFLPLPFIGNMLVSAPYSLVQFMLSTPGNSPGFFQIMSNFGGLGPFSTASLPTVTVEGHFATGTHSDRYFLMGPQGQPRDLVRIGDTDYFGQQILSNLGTVHESAMVGNWLVLRADSSVVAGQNTSLFVHDTVAGFTFNSSSLGAGDITAVSASSDACKLAWRQSGPGNDTIWLFDTHTSTVTAASASPLGGMVWTQTGALIYGNGGAVFSSSPGIAPTFVASTAQVITVL